MCPGCRADLETGRPYCTGCLLAAVPFEKPVPAALPKGRECRDPDCVHSGVLPAEACRHCGRRARAVLLRFPWGTERLPTGGPLLIGRENSPLAERLARYPNVSRRHAELALDAGAVVVTDLDSVNGTFVNDERLAPGVPVRAGSGDRLRFAAALIVEVGPGGAP
nr:FHA domain-containing protein [Virgisporangium aliadipatigenens]